MPYAASFRARAIMPLQVFANKYGSIWNDGRRSMGMVWRCMMSKEG